MNLTDNAEEQVLKVLETNHDAMALRVIITGGGCVGFQYTFALAEMIEPNDIVVNDSGAIVVVDPQSYELIKESTLDFQNSLHGAAFSLSIPGSTSCGCGMSFTL